MKIFEYIFFLKNKYERILIHLIYYSLSNNIKSFHMGIAISGIVRDFIYIVKKNCSPITIVRLLHVVVLVLYNKYVHVFVKGLV
jgi:hypothetical protein